MYLPGGHTTRNAQSEAGQLAFYQRWPTLKVLQVLLQSIPQSTTYDLLINILNIRICILLLKQVTCSFACCVLEITHQR